jgi:hypothetical protein
VRATIDETGCLRVTAETALESYALGAWSSAYLKNEGGDGQSWLVVENVRVSPPQTTEQGPHLANCTKKLQAAGKAYPRTCPECGLGPCRA